MAGVDFMNSFLIISSPDALSFFSFFIHIRSSSRVMLSFGITGKLLKVIKSMYSKHSGKIPDTWLAGNIVPFY
jgi:hypothetical protein